MKNKCSIQHISIENFIPLTINDGTTSIGVTVEPRVGDVLPAFNQIVSIAPSGVTITMLDDTLLTSTNRPGPTGSFTASRGTYTTDTTATSTSGSGSSGSGSGTSGVGGGY